MNRRKFLEKMAMAGIVFPLKLKGMMFNKKVSELVNFISGKPTKQYAMNKYKDIPSTWSIAPQEMSFKLVEGLSTRGSKTKIWSFAKNTFAPPIILEQHKNTKIYCKNSLKGEDFSIHWHGLRIPNAMDGVAGITQPSIRYQQVFEYSFNSPDAGTFWYHPHTNSGEQLGRGLVAPLIVKEAKPYPVDDDQIIFIKDWKLDRTGELTSGFDNRMEMMHDGRLGNLITVNGAYRPEIGLKPNSRNRLRIINASNARINALAFPSSFKVYVIAKDSHSVVPIPYQVQWIGPGMRLDLVVDVPSRVGNYEVTDVAYEKFNLFRIKVRGKAVRNKTLAKKPIALAKNPLKEPNLSKAKKLNLALTGGAMSASMLRGMRSNLAWELNGEAMGERDHSQKPLFSMHLNKNYLINLSNKTAFIHPIHLHGHSFKVLSFNGRKLKRPYFSDTVLLSRDETAEVALLADNPGKWMIHCHIIEHMAGGMMGVVEVG